jgi:HlyD family secretion protein
MKKVIRIAIILIIIASAIIGYTIYKKKQSKPEWRMGSLSHGTIRETVTASGTLNPSLLVNVGTEISGKIEKLYKDYNSNVSKGDLLAKLDTENLETSLETAQSDVQKAQISVNDNKIDLDLQSVLHKKDMSTDYEFQKAKNKYDTAVQNLANARFALKRAEKNLQNAIIKSPIDGVIVSRNVDEGQTVAASLNAPTLFVIANNLRKMQINADIDEADIGKIKVGLPVEFRVDAYANEQFEGKVNQVRLSPTSSQNVVTYSVIIDVDNPQMKLLPGMTANVTIIIREKEDILRIPESAMLFKPSKELWKQFGLKWDDSLTESLRKGRRNQQGESSATATGQSQGTMGKAGETAMGNIPDSIKAKFAKMTPEQRAAYREKMSKDGKKPDFSKMTDEQKAAFRKKAMQGKSDAKSSTESNVNRGQFNFSANVFSMERQKKNRVWVLENGKPKALEVITGLSDGNFAEVISGITENQEMIIGVNYKNAKQASAANKSVMTPAGGFGPRP